MSSLNGELIVCGQHSGDPVQLRAYGDEFYARYETPEGYTVVYDTDRGCYCYATLAAARFVSTGVPTHKPVPKRLKRHLKEGPEVRNERFGRRYAQLRPREPASGSSESRTLGPDGGLLEGRKLTSGDVRGLTIMVDFDDLSTNIAKGDLEEMLNGDGYQENGNHCSVKEYFQIVSNGKLGYTNTVVGPIRLSKRRSHYIGTLLVEEALDKAVSDFGIDLSDFDSRNDGIVDAINFLYAGDSQYAGNLWPHNSVKILHHGGVRTHYYLLTGLGMEKVDLRIGTICHENGHLLCRFPDMYDYGERDGDFEKSQGIGRYCLMGSGNHLNDRRTPSPVCAYLRDLVDWTDNVIDLNGPATHAAQHGDYGTVMKYRTDKANEYFIVENRIRRGLDSHLPASGLAIYHCDTLGSNEWEDGTRNRHYQCALLQADGHLDLENNRNAGDAGDLFSDVSGKALFHDTTPSSREWDDTDSGLLISDVGPGEEVISFTVGQSERDVAHGENSPNLLIPDDDPEGVLSEVHIDTVGRAMSIEVSVFIIHSWISDLKVTLRAPDGTEVVLHNKEGHDGDDIARTWRSLDFGPLEAMAGTHIKGDWGLWVVDSASADVGRLIHWSVDIGYEKDGGVIEKSVSPNEQIPDMNFVGISSSIPVDAVGVVKDVTVELDIEHSYIGDLEVVLVAPSGQSARLHDKEGTWQDNIKRSYDLGSTPALLAMVDQPMEGDWTLRVRDLAPADVGVLKSWSIALSY
jgi:M6 family metalloprotease-like protein